MSVCNDSKKELNTIIQNDNEKDQHIDLGLDVFENEAETSGQSVSSVLEDDFTVGIIDEDIATIGKKFINRYGKDSERLFYAQYLYGIIQTNQIIAPIIEELALVSIGPGIKAGGKLLKGKDTKVYNNKGKIILSRLSKGVLKYLIYEAQQFGEKNGKNTISFANFDGYIARKLTPERRARRDPSLGYLLFSRRARQLASNVASRMLPFTSRTVSSTGVGMSEVLHKVKLLGADIKGTNIEEKLTGMFIRYNRNWIYLDKKTNKFMIFEKYGGYKITNELGHQEWATYDDGTLKKGFHSPVPLKTYTPPNKPQGDWYVDLPPDKIAEFIELSKEAQQINNKLFKYFKENFKSSTTALVEALMKATNYEISEETLRNYIFKGKEKIPVFKEGVPVDFINILEAPGMSKENIETLEELKKVFAFSINDEMIIANGGKFDFDEIRQAKMYWPILYSKFRLPELIGVAANELIQKIDEATLFLEGGVWENGDPITEEEAKNGRKYIRQMEAQLMHANQVERALVNMGEQNDGSSDVPFGYASDNKYFKSISGMYDIRQMRVTEGSYTDMVKAGMAQIERNLLAAELVKSIAMSKEINLIKNKNEKLHKAVKDAIINLYGILYNSPDVRGPFGITTNKINNTLNTLRPGRNKNAQQTMNTMRIVRQYIGGVYLSGVSTVAQNYIDQFRNIFEFGLDRYTAATKIWTPKSMEREGAERIIEQSGVLTFDEFFSVNMVNDIIHVDVEIKASYGIMQSMIKFHYNKNRMKTSDARKIFEKEIQKYLDESTAITKAVDFPIRDKKVTAAAIYDLKQQKKLMFTAKLVEYAIRKEFVFSDLIKDARKNGWNWKAFVFGPPQKAMQLLSNFWRQKGLTMSSTEQDIRALSFIIGANMIEEQLGLLEGEGIHWWQLNINRTKKALNKDGKWVNRRLTDEEIKNEIRLIREVIKAGMTYERYVNFGLSSQFVGEQYAGDFGKWMGIFKIWATQKFGSDLRKIIDAYAENKGKDKVIGGKFDSLAILKMGKGLNPFDTNLRTTNPKTAAWRSFILVQGPLTLMWDFAMVQAFPAISIYKWMRIFGSDFKSTRGFTSDLISLMFLPLILLLKFGLALGEDDDEGPEDLSDILAYYSRKGTFGFIPQWSFELVLSFMDALLGNKKEAIQRATNAAGPISGGNIVPGIGPIRKGVKAGAEKIFEED